MFHRHKSCIKISFHILRSQSFKMPQLESLKFDNLALRRLPIDEVEETCVRTVNAACFSKVSPTPVVNPKLVAHSPSALSLLDLDLDATNEDEFVEYFSGNKKLPGSETAAHCYCGYQFGAFAGQLGDGAVIYLGEVINSKNERWEIQLKGAGKTPFSRTADGRKVLRSSIREFLCSEAMHCLGIPTTRAGTLITSDTVVSRDKLYDGHPTDEKCTVLLRIAPTFLRFGSFEIFTPLNRDTGKFGPSVGRVDILETMLNYVIETFYPEIHALPLTIVEKYAEFYKEVVLRTARLVALWQSVGFCHGVLNTDNMSVLGLTIDYGPFGFLDIYNPDHICNASDVSGRYKFRSQPEICKWNLRKFAEAIQLALPFRISSAILDELYDEEFDKTYMNKMRLKLGLIASEVPEDKRLVQELFDTMESTGADFTNTFLFLHFLDVSNHSDLLTSIDIVRDVMVDHCYSLEVLLKYYRPAFLPGQLETFKEITTSNPAIVRQPGPEGMAIRNVMAQIRKVEILERLVCEPRKISHDREEWSYWISKYRRRVIEDRKAFDGDSETYNLARRRVMRDNNPRTVLRNYLAQDAIEKAEEGDYSDVQEMIKTMKRTHLYDFPRQAEKLIRTGAFKKPDGIYSLMFFDRPMDEAFSLKITCSS